MESDYRRDGDNNPPALPYEFAKHDIDKERRKVRHQEGSVAKYDILSNVAFRPGECGKTPPHAGGGEQQ